KSYSDSTYLRKEDFPEPKRVTVEEAREEEVQAPGEKAKLKLVLYFKELEKGMVLNQTNGRVLERITESEYPDKWIGTQVKIYHDPDVMFAGEVKGGLRLANLPRAKPVSFKPLPKKTSQSLHDVNDNLAEAAGDVPY